MSKLDDSVTQYQAARQAFREARGAADRAVMEAEAAGRQVAAANRLVEVARERLSRAAERIEPELGKEFRSDTGAALVTEKAPAAPVATAEPVPVALPPDGEPMDLQAGGSLPEMAAGL